MHESHPLFSNELHITRCYVWVRVAERTVTHSPLATYIYCTGGFFAHTTIEIRLSECHTFTWSFAVDSKWQTTPPPQKKKNQS
jgi:hypothetical protein